MAEGGPDLGFRQSFASLGADAGTEGPRRSVRLQKKRAAVDALLHGVSPLDLLPREAWEMVAQRLLSVQDLWALTGSCRWAGQRKDAPGARLCVELRAWTPPTHTA